jgi:hypothetical protein
MNHGGSRFVSTLCFRPILLGLVRDAGALIPVRDDPRKGAGDDARPFIIVILGNPE